MYKTFKFDYKIIIFSSVNGIILMRKICLSVLNNHYQQECYARDEDVENAFEEVFVHIKNAAL